MKGSIRTSLIAFFVLLALAATADAQEQSVPWRVWGGFGGGFSGEGAAVTGQLVFQKAPHQLMARAVLIADPYDAASNPIGEIGLLYGRTAMGKAGHVSLSTGFAIVDTDMDSEMGMTVGVPIVAEAAVRIFPVMGLGAQVFGNLNSIDSYGGGVLFIQLGWMPANIGH